MSNSLETYKRFKRLANVAAADGGDALRDNATLMGDLWQNAELDIDGAYTSGSPHELTAAESRSTFTCMNSESNYTLSVNAAGLLYTFIQEGTGELIVTASGDAVIKASGESSIANGSIASLVQGASITLLNVDGSTWLAINIVGFWDLETS